MWYDRGRKRRQQLLNNVYLILVKIYKLNNITILVLSHLSLIIMKIQYEIFNFLKKICYCLYLTTLILRLIYIIHYSEY